MRVNTRSDYLKFPVTIPVYFHLITRGEDGHIPEQVLDEQIRILNQDYKSTGLFKFAKVGTTKTEGARYWASRGETLYPESHKQYMMKKDLRQGDSSTLNIYVTLLGEGLLGYATFPVDYKENPLVCA